MNRLGRFQEAWLYPARNASRHLMRSRQAHGWLSVSLALDRMVDHGDRTMARRLAFVGVIGWLVLLPLGCIQDFAKIHESDMPRIGAASQENPPAPPKERFNARALWDEYANVLQADLDCKGKSIQVTGIVRIVALDDRSRPYIGFQVFEPVPVPAARLRMMKAKEKSWIQEGYPPLVICYLDSAEQSQPAQIKKGGTVQLVGRCLGRVKDPSGFKDYVVVLDSCRLEE